MFGVTQHIGFMAGPTEPPIDYSAYNSYLVNVVADSYSPNKGYPAWDSTDLGSGYWEDYFSEFQDTGVFDYEWQAGAVADTGTQTTTTITLPRLTSLRLFANNGSWYGDIADIDLEFLDSSDNVELAIRIKDATGGDFRNDWWIGNSLGSGSTWSGVIFAYGGVTMTFQSGKVVFSDSDGGTVMWPDKPYTGDHLCDALDIKKLRISAARAKSNYTGGTGGAYVWLKYVP